MVCLEFNQKEMREHLSKCYAKKKPSFFPQLEEKTKILFIGSI